MVYWPQEDSLKRNILSGADKPQNLASLYHKSVLGNGTFFLSLDKIDISKRVRRSWEHRTSRRTFLVRSLGKVQKRAQQQCCPTPMLSHSSSSSFSFPVSSSFSWLNASNKKSMKKNRCCLQAKLIPLRLFPLTFRHHDSFTRIILSPYHACRESCFHRPWYPCTVSTRPRRTKRRAFTDQADIIACNKHEAPRSVRRVG